MACSLSPCAIQTCDSRWSVVDSTWRRRWTWQVRSTVERRSSNVDHTRRWTWGGVARVRRRQLILVLNLTSPPKVIWGEPRRHPSQQETITPQSSHWLECDAPNLSPKLPLPLRRSPPPSNTPIPRLTPLTTPNGIQICSAVLPQYTFRTDRHTHADGLTDRSVTWALRLLCW